MTIPMCHRVRDRVTGFEGVVVSRHTYLFGCTRLGVQGRVGQDGKLGPFESFDEPSLVDLGPEPELAHLLPAVNEPRTPRTPGGPRDDPVRVARSTG